MWSRTSELYLSAVYTIISSMISVILLVIEASIKNQHNFSRRCQKLASFQLSSLEKTSFHANVSREKGMGTGIKSRVDQYVSTQVLKKH
jgi:hypothetical protein